MAVYIGDDGGIKKINTIRIGTPNGIKTPVTGYVGGSDNKPHPFFGDPAPLNSMAPMLPRDLTFRGYEWDGSKWTNKTETALGSSKAFPEFYKFGAVATFSYDTYPSKITYNIKKSHYGYVYFNIYIIPLNDQTVLSRHRFDKMAESLGFDYSIQVTTKLTRTAGSGTWGGAVRIFGKDILPSGFSSNTEYTTTINSVAVANSYTVYALAYDKGGINGITIDITFDKIIVGSTEYILALGW